MLSDTFDLLIWSINVSLALSKINHYSYWCKIIIIVHVNKLNLIVKFYPFCWWLHNKNGNSLNVIWGSNYILMKDYEVEWFINKDQKHVNNSKCFILTDTAENNSTIFQFDNHNQNSSERHTLWKLSEFVDEVGRMTGGSWDWMRSLCLKVGRFIRTPVTRRDARLTAETERLTSATHESRRRNEK